MPTTPRRSAIEAKSAQRATSSRQVIPEAPPPRSGRRVDADPERVDAGADVAVGRQLAPADGIGLADAEPAAGVRITVLVRPGGRAGDLATVRRVHDDRRRAGRRRTGRTQLDRVGAVSIRLDAGLGVGLERRVRAAAQGLRARRAPPPRAFASRALRPARSERWPKIGATSRSAKSITASAIQVAAKPNAQTAHRGLTPRPVGTPPRRRTSSRSGGAGRPSGRRASRSARGRGTAAPETKSAPEVTSDQYGEASRAPTTASWIAPAAVAACAQRAWRAGAASRTSRRS